MKSFIISFSVLAAILELSCGAAGAEHLYVLDTGGDIYDYNTANGNDHTFVSGLGITTSMVFDENTNLYVTFEPEGPYGGGFLIVAPDKTVTTNGTGVGSGASPFGLTVGPGNTVWVADTENQVIYAYGGRALARNLEPLALAFDTRSNLYATDYSGNIYRFTNTASGLSGSPDTFAAAPDGPPYALAFDGVGNLFVTFDNGIYEFTNHVAGLSSSRGVFNHSIDPVGLAFDSSGDLFAGTSDGDLYEFTNTPAGLSAEPTLFASLNSIAALAIVPSSPPKLSINATSTNVAVSWPAPGFGLTFPWLWPESFTLQHNQTLSSDQWTTFNGSFTTNSMNITATISPPPEQDFFRLAHP